MPFFDHEVADLRRWFESPRFAGIKRLHSAREVIEQRGSIRADYVVARDAAEAFHARLRQLFAEKKCTTTFGRSLLGQAADEARRDRGDVPRRVGDERRGGDTEDPGPDSASDPSGASPRRRRPSSARCSMPSATSTPPARG